MFTTESIIILKSVNLNRVLDNTACSFHWSCISRQSRFHLSQIFLYSLHNFHRLRLHHLASTSRSLSSKIRKSFVWKWGAIHPSKWFSIFWSQHKETNNTSTPPTFKSRFALIDLLHPQIFRCTQWKRWQRQTKALMYNPTLKDLLATTLVP